MRPTPVIVLFISLALLAGCEYLQPYRLNIQQGNYIESEDVEQVEVGMSRSQVRFLLGTPMVADPFNPERWDYVFFFKLGRTRDTVKSKLTIWFEDDRVVKIERPDVDDPLSTLDPA